MSQRLRSQSVPWQPVPGDPSLRFRYYVATDIGTKRANNEDNYLVRPDLGLFAVADGMGGHASGEVASMITSEEIGRVLEELETDMEARLDRTMGTTDPFLTEAALSEEEAALRYAVAHTHAALRRRMQEDPALDRIGSTLVALLFRRGHAYVFNVGDSRAYRYHEVAIEQITQDHTAFHPDKFTGRLRSHLTRTMGGSRPMTTPDLFLLRPAAGDRYLLCTDGVWGKLTEDELRHGVQFPDLKIACESLIRQAIDRGSTDNLTTLLVELMPAEEVTGEQDEEMATPIDPTAVTTGE